MSVVLVSSCMQITTPLNNIVRLSSVKQKAKAIFLRQNSALSQVIMLTIDDENDEDELLLVEQQVLDACSAINAYASKMNLGETPGLLAQQRVLNSLAACEGATQKLEYLLKQYKAL